MNCRSSTVTKSVVDTDTLLSFEPPANAATEPTPAPIKYWRLTANRILGKIHRSRSSSNTSIVSQSLPGQPMPPAKTAKRCDSPITADAILAHDALVFLCFHVSFCGWYIETWLPP